MKKDHLDLMTEHSLVSRWLSNLSVSCKTTNIQHGGRRRENGSYIFR